MFFCFQFKPLTFSHFQVLSRYLDAVNALTGSDGCYPVNIPKAIGEFPTSTVAVTVFVAVSITETLLSQYTEAVSLPEFVIYADCVVFEASSSLHAADPVDEIRAKKQNKFNVTKNTEYKLSLILIYFLYP